MGFIEKRNGRYRARYRDPLGHRRCETFTRKGDAEQFLRETQVDIERGRWIDPAAADVPLERWAGEFLQLARRLSPSTQETRGTCAGTCCRGSAPTGSGGCPPRRSRTG